MGAPAILLSFATIFGCIAVACVAVAFATDCWVEYDVNRQQILEVLRRDQLPGQDNRDDINKEMNRTSVWFDRTVGLWRQCYPSEIPYGMEVYLSPTDTSCTNIEYPKGEDPNWDPYQRARFYLMRTILALFVAGFAMEMLSFFIGVFGCWRRSAALLISTGTFMLLAWLLHAGALAVWHGVDYIETKKLGMRPYELSWPQVLRDNTTRHYSWSFMLAWIGCGFALLSAIFLYAGAGTLRAERRKEAARATQYVMPVYGGYGNGDKHPPYFAHAYSAPGVAGPYYYYNTNTYKY
ncbi:hypothetical protein BV898_13332 [Hypsibius exemplaris]|uniref:Claudin domain-containing protein 1 n=1 Tax=Hypsibius exemplaris TaxID=2072580 RepID=A0A1W0WAZ1_HYPEX|nr:hypothetical protein BV898_13332 [Hypsibius exemplaris]